MKKAVIITLFLCSLVSCSNNTINEQPEKASIITETTTVEETAQEIGVSPATEQETITELLYEDENVTIIFNGYESLKTVQSVYFTIENKTANKIKFDTLDFKANGIPIDENHGGMIEAHKTVSPEWTLLNSRIQEANITRVNKLEFKLRLIISENLEQYETDIITIER